MENAVSQHQAMASAEFAGILTRQGQRAKADILTLGQGQDMPLETKLKKTKVNPNSLNRLSELAKWILCNTGDGIDRADIVARYFGIERLYCGFYLDPCFRPKERRRHNRQYRYGQPQVTMTLKRLEKRGFVCLTRHRKYVKKVCLTEKGKAVAEQLDRTADTYGDIK